jgi:hypothetical protein
MLLYLWYPGELPGHFRSLNVPASRTTLCFTLPRSSPATPYCCMAHIVGSAGVPLLVAGLQGAGHVYQRWLQPTLLEYEPVIDQSLAESRAQLGDFVTSNLARLVQQVREKGAVLLAQVQQQAQLKVGTAPGRT